MTNPTEFLSRTGYRQVAASTAIALSPGANINGVLFTGAGNITVAAAAGTLTGTTLAANVTTSSLTSVGTLANLAVTNPITGAVTGNAGTVTTINGKITQGTNVTITGSGTFGSPYNISASGGGGGSVAVVQKLGQVADGTVTFPAKSVPLQAVCRETAGGTIVGNVSLQFGAGAVAPISTPTPNDIVFQDLDAALGDNAAYAFYSASPVTLTITTGGWGGASLDTFITYITLP